jgi:hypothetical protein
MRKADLRRRRRNRRRRGPIPCITRGNHPHVGRRCPRARGTIGAGRTSRGHGLDTRSMPHDPPADGKNAVSTRSRSCAIGCPPCQVVTYSSAAADNAQTRAKRHRSEVARDHPRKQIARGQIEQIQCVRALTTTTWRRESYVRASAHYNRKASGKRPDFAGFTRLRTEMIDGAAKSLHPAQLDAASH